MSRIETEILNFLQTETACSSAQIAALFANEISLATVKRILQKLVANEQIIKTGDGKNTRYRVSNAFKKIFIEQYQFALDTYF